jgi:hypothetical protein
MGRNFEDGCHAQKVSHTKTPLAYRPLLNAITDAMSWNFSKPDAESTRFAAAREKPPFYRRNMLSQFNVGYRAHLNPTFSGNEKTHFWKH